MAGRGVRIGRVSFPTRACLVAAAIVAVASCSGDAKRISFDAAPVTEPTDVTSAAAAPPTTQPSSDPAPAEDLTGRIVVAADGSGRRFDPRLLGTNVPAWLGPELLGDPEFRRRTVALGTTVLRMPGGSWSNYYAWDACETGDATTCYWPWAARPSDFMDLIAGTGIPAMWTVNVNGTPQEAAALVAFFNGDVDDQHEIGEDRRGRDWGTVGDWARLRAARGHLEPVPVRLWEVGNEVFAGKSLGDDDCAAFGWEDVWTCDGADYVTGDADHDGFLGFRSAMQAVDPDILVGAVGVNDQSSWGNWGNEVIEAAGASLDFYVVHHYGFDSEPDLAGALARPTAAWPAVMADLRESLALWSPKEAVPVAVTEYNLVALETADSEALMTKAVNALFTADTIGEMAVTGVSIANHWNLANGRAANGTDYGMIDTQTLARSPQYYGMAIWNGFRGELLHVRTGFPADTVLSAYAARSDTGGIDLVVINKTTEPIATAVELDDGNGMFRLRADVVAAPTLDAQQVTLNGSTEPSADLEELGAAPAEPVPASFDFEFAPLSVTRLRLEPSS